MLHAVIMAGGSGTRFWPESRQRRPKQLLPITGGKAMIAETIERLDPLIPMERVWVVTNVQQADGVRACCPELPAENVLIEPCARNTAACAAFAATMIALRDADATLAVLPADHQISPAEVFQRSLVAGAEAAQEEGVLVTFGIQPTYAATGYGYIQQGSLRGSCHAIDCYQVIRFHEKPDQERADAYFASGDYLWNAGIFVWRADTILAAFARHMPALAASLERIGAAAPAERDALIEQLYPSLEKLPVDVGILERHDQVRVLRAPYRWSDIGSWQALYQELPHDDDGNATVFPEGGRLLCEKAQRVFAYSSRGKTIAVLGLDDLIVVDSGDALLVAARDQAETVKVLVERLKEMGADEVL